MGLEEEEQAKRAAELKAKIAQRNQEREERQKAGGAPAMAIEAEKKKAEAAKAAKKSVIPKPLKKTKKTKKTERTKAAKVAKVAKVAKKPKAAETKARAPKNGSAPRRVMDRDKSTGFRPIEAQIIRLCRRVKKPLDVRTIADKLFGSDKVLEAAGGKDNKRLREVRNAIRVPLQKEVLCKAGHGRVVHKDFAEQSLDPVSVGLAAHSKAKKVARKATGKRT